MLKKVDLDQIRRIVREEIEAEVRVVSDNLQSEIKLARMTLSNRLDGLEDRLKNLEVGVNRLDKEVKAMRSELKAVASTLDKDFLKLRDRVQKIEDHLDIASS